MKKQVFRLVFGCSLSMIVGAAVAQQSASHGSSGGGSHSSGGSSGSSQGSSRSSGSSTSGGGYRSGNSGGYQSGSGGYRSGGSFDGGSRYSSRYGQGSTSSRYQSRGSQESSGSTRSEGSSYSRYSRSQSGGYEGRSSSSVGGGASSRGSSSFGESGAANGFTRGHADVSRSGMNHYEGNNNRMGTPGAAAVQEKFNPAPHGLLGPSLGHVIGNGGNFDHNGWRHGYYGYWGGWRDSFFAFPFYVFDPFFAACYVSPWYYYPCLPGYVAAPNVVIVDSYPSTNWTGNDYEWDPGSHASTNPVLDDSVQDLVASFEGDDHKAIDRVAPHSGNVNIYVDGKYSYSLKANDFYDTYVDGIESTKTDRYEILEVKANANGTARVVAKHVYNDPWGNRTYVYHSYFLVKEGDTYVIREFGTSDYRTGW